MSSEKKEVLKTKICCSCNKEKEIDFYWRNNQTKDGRDNKCKPCKIKGLFCRKKKVKTIRGAGKPKNINGPQLINVREKDWIEAYEFLKKIGYDLSSDKTIHQQFCEKHNLKPKKRTYERSIQYTPKDLGLS